MAKRPAQQRSFPWALVTLIIGGATAAAWYFTPPEMRPSIGAEAAAPDAGATKGAAVAAPPKPTPGKSVTLRGGGALPQAGKISFTPRKWFNKAMGKNGRIHFKFHPAPDIVMLDGQPISPPFDKPLEVKPGSHQIVASSTELGVTESADIVVEPGEEYDVGLDLAVIGKH